LIICFSKDIMSSNHLKLHGNRDDDEQVSTVFITIFSRLVIHRIMHPLKYYLEQNMIK
jgi:hypothetical protein